MNGIELMMKSMGIDQDKIKAELKQFFDTASQAVMKEVGEIKAAQKRIEQKLDKVLEVRGSMDAMNAIENESEALQHTLPDGRQLDGNSNSPGGDTGASNG